MNKETPEVIPGLDTPEIPAIDNSVPIEVINGALEQLINEEKEAEKEEIRKPTLH